MRIWDISARKLCCNHLLGEHRELHAVWSILVRGKKGYSHHPETLRWIGKLKALYSRHVEEVREMERRGYRHDSPLNRKLASGKSRQTVLVNSRNEQITILRNKKCNCDV